MSDGQKGKSMNQQAKMGQGCNGVERERECKAGGGVRGKGVGGRRPEGRF